MNKNWRQEKFTLLKITFQHWQNFRRGDEMSIELLYNIWNFNRIIPPNVNSSPHSLLVKLSIVTRLFHSSSIECKIMNEKNNNSWKSIVESLKIQILYFSVNKCWWQNRRWLLKSFECKENFVFFLPFSTLDCFVSTRKGKSRFQINCKKNIKKYDHEWWIRRWFLLDFELL